MLLLSPPVTMAAGKTRARAAQPRVSIRRDRAPTHEVLRPADLGLGQLFVHIRDALVVGNVDTGRIALWNPAAERLFGWSTAEAIGQPIDILIPPTILLLHREGMALYRRTGEGSVIESREPIEVPALNKHGEQIRVELSLAPVDDPSGAAHYVLAMFRDTSDRRRAEMQSLETTRAESAKRDADEALRQQQRLLQDGSDELRHALEQLQRSAQRLTRKLTRGDGDPSLRLGLSARVVQARAGRLRRLVDELAASAAVQARSLDLSPERLNLVPLISRVVADVRSRGTPHKLTLAVPQGLTVVADPARIEQVIRTLLDDALARNPRGCWIDVDLRRPLVGLARLEVREFGRAVSEEQRERLMDPFEEERALALSRYIIERHGGALSVEFPTDGGLRVIVTLPTQRARVLPNAG